MKLYLVTVRIKELGWQQYVVNARSRPQAKAIARDYTITSVVQWGAITELGTTNNNYGANDCVVAERDTIV